MSEPIEDIIRKLALQNAVFFKGKANPKAIVGKILGQYPEYRAKVAEITETINGIVEDVNAMGFDAQKAELEKADPSISAIPAYPSSTTNTPRGTRGSSSSGSRTPTPRR